MKSRFRKLVSLILGLALMLCSMTSVFAKTKVVSEIVLSMGEKADDELFSEGFDVIYANLNKTGNDKNNIYLGCAYGEEGITNIITSDKLAQSITVDGIEYLLVSELNLNEGSDGEDIYLYYTKDEKAGSVVTSIDVRAKYAAGDEIILGYEDDYKVVLNELGERSNLEQGKEDYVTYLLLSRIDDEEKHPYVYSDNSSVDLQKGEERDQEVISNKEYVDDETPAEEEVKEKAIEEKKQDGKDDTLGNAVIFICLGAIVLVFVLVLVLKNKKGGKKDEK